MTEKQVDARGLACPQPVILTKRAIEEGGAETVRVTVDNDVACQNVQRMARSQGWDAAVERAGGDIHVLVHRGQGAPALANEPMSRSAEGRAPRVTVLVASDLFGVGEQELGRILMRAFIKTVKELTPRPAQLIFANSGVRLTTEGSELVEELRALESSGVEVISCGTCLDYYGLVDKLEVGKASNMYEIASSLVAADRVVRP